MNKSFYCRVLGGGCFQNDVLIRMGACLTVLAVFSVQGLEFRVEGPGLPAAAGARGLQSKVEG
jgi:hypothetical protein